MINKTALDYWKHTGYTKENFEEVSRKFDNTLAAKIVFYPNRSIKAIISSETGRTGQGHFPTCIKFMEEVASTWKGKALEGEIVLWLHDGMWMFDKEKSRQVPIFAFGRNRDDYETLLIPDPAFLADKGYEKEFERIDDMEEKLKWDKKTPTVFWRGASSGFLPEANDEQWKEDQRIKLSILCDKYNDLPRFDAFISKVVEYRNKEHSDRIYRLGFVREYINFFDFVQYRYQVDVDGYSCAWRSLFLKLYMNSAVLKIKGVNVQWYYDRLKAWENYIPVDPDLEDLYDRIDWVFAHDEQCKEISANATALAKDIRYEDEIQKTGALIEQILAYRREA